MDIREPFMAVRGDSVVYKSGGNVGVATVLKRLKPAGRVGCSIFKFLAVDQDTQETLILSDNEFSFWKGAPADPSIKEIAIRQSASHSISEKSVGGAAFNFDRP